LNRRVLVTRPEPQAETLTQAFRDAGASVIRIPAFRIEAIRNEALECSLAAAGGLPYDTVVFTSHNAVEYFLEILAAAGGRLDDLGGVEVGTVGSETAGALERRGVRVDVVAEPHTAEGLVDALRHKHGGEMSARRVLYPKAADARTVVTRGLEEMGARVDAATIYGAVPEALDASRGHELDPAPDVVTFASPSAAVHLEATLARSLAPGVCEGLKTRSVTACIGPVTEAQARGLGYRVEIVASRHTAAGLVDAVVDYFHKEH
jgi:uroporphyrinogen-III synthase